MFFHIHHAHTSLSAIYPLYGSDGNRAEQSEKETFMLQSINENAMESKQTLSVPACRLLKFLFRAGSQNHGMRLVSEKQIPAMILQRLHFCVPE
ncbi:hypothetical protein CIAN88_15965 [[Clostridium] innocuum]|uniref:Uncharacterized protein n=1 Tax=Clostridium innocuum TaxID=1522 RepID=A0A099I3I3_CLOIN|nr:hypothetical protein CIAN88_15965 [[Clostridium] innocuum]